MSRDSQYYFSSICRDLAVILTTFSEKDNLEVFGKGKSYNAVQHTDGSPPSNALDGLIGMLLNITCLKKKSGLPV